MNFVMYIFCTAAFIGGFDKKTSKMKGFNIWPMSVNRAEHCKVHAEDNIIRIDCKDTGEIFILPGQHCSVSYMKKPKGNTDGTND